MSTPLEKLKELAKSWGGEVVELSEEEFRKYTRAVAVEFPGGTSWRTDPPEGFYEAPFSGHNLGVHWEEKKVIFSGNVPWPELIHEMGHVFAAMRNPNTCKEWQFFGWEYALVKFIQAPIDEWFESMTVYQLGNGEEFGYLSPERRDQLIKRRLNAAQKSGLVKGGVPQAIR